MRPSTYCWRAVARGRLASGLAREGALGMPASMAASDGVTSDSGLPK
ncbi:Uncharacterised protein [Bordetella pertussis]|nr:Uncharacterised protein [Bordetella pertussis]